MQTYQSNYNIKVFGVGGGGSNTVDYIKANPISFVTTYAVNTDAQALNNSQADKKIHIGVESTKGLGAGALPEIGRRAAEESREQLIEAVKGAQIVFIAAGMGGGTGTGAAPYIASIAKEMGILTIGVVTKPFVFEGGSRMEMALEGINTLQSECDVTIVIPNEKLIANHRNKYIEDAFMLPDEVLRTAIEAIVDILANYSNYTANFDINELVAMLSNCGLAVLGIGTSMNDEISAPENLVEALRGAINSDILEISIDGAQRFIIQISGSIEYITANEVEIPGQVLEEYLGYKIICSTTIREDDTLGEKGRRIRLIAADYADRDFINQIIEPPVTTPIVDGMFSGI